MWRWWLAGAGWSRPWDGASRSTRPASAVAGWGPCDQGPANDGRRVAGRPRLGRADRGRARRRARWRLPGGPGRVRRSEAAMIGAVWLLALPFRLLAALGLRRSIILACLLVLAVTAYGVAEDLGLIEPPAHAAPAPKPAVRQPRPSRT